MSSFPSHVPSGELQARRSRCREVLARDIPSAGGLLVFSQLNIYYLTGTLGSGLLWLPLEEEAVLLCRRGEARARLESPLPRIGTFRSFREIAGLLDDAGAPLTTVVAAEMSGLSWSLSNLLQTHLSGTSFVAGDAVLAKARAVKSSWELDRLRQAGGRHAVSLEALLPPLLCPGMTEEKIAHKAWEVFFGQGHQGLLRMEHFGGFFLGHIAAGESANYPSAMNGPVGFRGVHPAAPFMGSPGTVWQKGEPLVVDTGFSFEGYQTDKTQVYWAGSRQSVPDGVRRAHDFCVQLQGLLAERLLPGETPAALAAFSFARARREGWEEGFMALGSNKVSFIGHGIGLAIDEGPAVAEGFDDPFEEGMVIALEPKIGIPGLGMVGVENTFEVARQGGRCLTGHGFDLIHVPGC